MKKVEYIIVGGGFAALFFAHRLIQEGISFILFAEEGKTASNISAGMINPVVLKKFTTFDNALSQISELRKVLGEMEAYTGQDTLIDQPIHRIFHDEKEKETWLKKSEDENLSVFLNRSFVAVEGVNNPFGCGVVEQSFRIDVPLFFSSFFDYLESKGQLIRKRFEHSKINTETNQYGDISFSKIVFAEGIGVRNNPFFREIPIIVNKGHHLSIKINGFNQEKTFKKKHFLLPLSDGEYYYGGTYDRENETEQIDANAVEQLESGLKEIVGDDYEIVRVEYAFRPTTRDRKPILGQHKEHKNFYVFNGLGARGLLNGVHYSQALFNHIEKGEPIPEEAKSGR